jgi:hypothetical protein
MNYTEMKQKVYANTGDKITPDLCSAAIEWIGGGRYSLPYQLEALNIEWKKLPNMLNDMNTLANDILLDAIYGLGTSDEMRRRWYADDDASGEA